MSSLKYNRTFHLPWSLGKTKDDKTLKDVSNFVNKRIIITEKLDGSNVCLEKYNCFSRSHNCTPTHKSFDLLKQFHSTIKNSIPENIQIFGEWLYAKHSIYYTSLPNYFLVFNIRDLTNNNWESWDIVKEYCKELNLITVPVLFDGIVKSAKQLQEITLELSKQKSCFGDEIEGIVVRVFESFANDYFSKNVAKFVRKDHVKTSQHWSKQEIIRNKLKNG